MEPAVPVADAQLLARLRGFDFAFVVSDARQPDNPICFASAAFCKLTGYSASEVVGRNCRFLQTAETERRKVMELRDAIREDRACQTCLLNCKKNGQKFWNQLYVNPVLDDRGIVTHYVGIQTDVSDVLEKVAKGVAADDVDAVEDVKTIGQQERKRSMDVSECVKSDLKGDASSASHSPCSILPSSLLLSLANIQQSLVLVDPSQEDMPIVHAGEAFLKLTGYPREKVIGRNCRFLQGPDTDPAAVAAIRAAITADPPQPLTTTLLNYHYDGTPFWNYLNITPIRGADGQVAFFAGVQLDITLRPTSRRFGKKGSVEEPSATEQGDGGAASAMNGSDVMGPIEHGDVSIKHRLAHSGTMGKVKVAVRSLSGGDRGLRRARDSCELPTKDGAAKQ